jgi:hypothetical protein
MIPKFIFGAGIVSQTCGAGRSSADFQLGVQRVIAESYTRSSHESSVLLLG